MNTFFAWCREEVCMLTSTSKMKFQRQCRFSWSCSSLALGEGPGTLQTEPILTISILGTALQCAGMSHCFYSQSLQMALPYQEGTQHFVFLLATEMHGTIYTSFPIALLGKSALTCCRKPAAGMEQTRQR